MPGSHAAATPLQPDAQAVARPEAAPDVTAEQCLAAVSAGRGDSRSDQRRARPAGGSGRIGAIRGQGRAPATGRCRSRAGGKAGDGRQGRVRQRRSAGKAGRSNGSRRRDGGCREKPAAVSRRRRYRQDIRRAGSRARGAARRPDAGRQRQISVIAERAAPAPAAPSLGASGAAIVSAIGGEQGWRAASVRRRPTSRQAATAPSRCGR